MKKFFKPACLLLYLLTIIVFFFIGASFVGITGLAKNQGLAGGAILVFYALNFAFFALIASILVVYRFPHSVIVKANKILSISLIVLVVILTYLFLQRKKAKAETKISTHSLFVQADNNAGESESMGMGLFYPDFSEKMVIYFYGNPNTSKAVIEHPPIDSIVFYKTEHGNMDISYAPPWLVPEHLKLDYGIIYFKVLSISRDFAEVVVNSTNSKVAYVSRYAGTVSLWPEFLLGVYSVEFISETEHSVFIKPLAHASEVNTKYEIMQPKVIKGDWMQVELFLDGFVSVGFGWIKWKAGDRHLLRYSLLC